MDDNKEKMEKEKLEQNIDGKLEKREQKIIEVLNGRFHKIDIVTKNTNENKIIIQVKKLFNNKNMLCGFYLNRLMDVFLRASIFPRLN